MMNCRLAHASCNGSTACGLPAEQVKRIHQAIVTAFSSPEVKEAMNKQGNVIAVSSPSAAETHFKAELVKYATVVKRAGVVPQ